MGIHDLDQVLLPLVGYHARTVRRQFKFPESALLPQVKVCPICCGPMLANYQLCYACNERSFSFKSELADEVVPLSYAVRGHPTLQQFYSDLHQYKFDQPSLAAQQRLRALLLLFRHHHLACLETAIGQPVTSVIAVPSGRNRSAHPLPGIASELSRPIGGSAGVPLIPARFIGQPRTGRTNGATNPDEFAIDHELSGHVVIVEDTWVKGHNAQGLAVRARRQGAERVSIVVLARMLDYTYGPTKLMVDTWAENDHFDPYACQVTGAHH